MSKIPKPDETEDTTSQDYGELGRYEPSLVSPRSGLVIASRGDAGSK